MTEPPELSAGPRRGLMARWAAEVFVIALGILLAFSVDATWNNRQESEQAQLTLEALKEEFEANVASLRRTASAHDGVARAGDQLLERTGPAASKTADVARLIGEVWAPQHVELASGAIQSLLSSNDLARVRDSQLRRALAGWPNKVAAVVRIEDALHTSSTTRLIPTIQRTVPQIHIELINGFVQNPKLREEFVAAVEPSRFDANLALLLRDLEFENAVLHRMTVSMIARDRTVELADEAARILSMVEDGLN